MARERDLAEGLASELRCLIADKTANTIMLAVRACESDGRPLTDVQTASLIAAAIVEGDGLTTELAGHLRIDAVLATRGSELRDLLHPGEERQP